MAGDAPPGPALASSAGLKPFVENKDVSRPFHPQILRRPVQAPPEPPLGPPEFVEGRLTPPSRLSFDRRDSQPQEHKQTLLSLFNKPSPLVSPLSPQNGSIVSPLSEKPPQLGNLASTLPERSRSRIGSLTSVAGEGAAQSSGRQTPRATPLERNFLLGYLEGIAKGEGR